METDHHFFVFFSIFFVFFRFFLIFFDFFDSEGKSLCAKSNQFFERSGGTKLFLSFLEDLLFYSLLIFRLRGLTLSLLSFIWIAYFAIIFVLTYIIAIWKCCGWKGKAKGVINSQTVGRASSFPPFTANSTS